MWRFYTKVLINKFVLWAVQMQLITNYSVPYAKPSYSEERSQIYYGAARDLFNRIAAKFVNTS